MVIRHINLYFYSYGIGVVSLSLLQHFRLQPAPCAWGEKAGNRAISAIRRDSTLSKFLIGGQALECG